MKKTDKKVKKYLERANELYPWDCPKDRKKSVIEIAKMIQREEAK